MFRTPFIAALTVALLGGTAMAQPANAPPADLSNSARTAPNYDDDDGYAPGLGNLKGVEVNAQRDAEARARDAKITAALSGTPGLTRNQISELTGETPALVRYALNRLRRRGFVAHVGKGFEGHGYWTTVHRDGDLP